MGLRRDKSDILEMLQQEGVVELMDLTAVNEDISDEKLLTSKDDDSLSLPEDNLSITNSENISEQTALLERTQSIRATQNRIEKTLRYLDENYPNVLVPKESLKIDLSDFLALEKREKAILDLLDEVYDLTGRKESIQSEKDMIYREQEILEKWRNVDLNLAQTSTKRTAYFLGSIAQNKLPELENDIEKTDYHTVILTLEELESHNLISVVTLKENQFEVDNLLKQAGFKALPISKAGTPNQIYQQGENLLKNAKKNEEEINERLKEIASQRLDFYLLFDYYTSLLDKYSALANTDNTKSTFSMEGFIPRESSSNVKDKLNENFVIFIDIEELSADDEEHPILLKNKGFNGAYQTILEMFGAPNTREIDPTPGLAPFTFLFFGMMLSDVGYGLLLTIACAFLIWKVKLDPNSESGKLSKMLFLSGISSTIWGFIFGGFFGDLLTIFSNGKYSFPCLWFNPMDNPQKLLIWSMIFGVIHLFAGLVMKAINEIKFGKKSNILFDVVPWYLIILGLGLLLAGSSLDLGGFDLTQVGKWMAIVGAVIILLFAGRDKKNPIMRIFSGVGGLYGAINYLGDILSYTRVLALVLATSVIATVVNFLAQMLSGGILGTIFAIVVLILGHLLNLALSGLSAYVHASRLQYVEFFGQFFEGGGKFFDPLQYQTKHIEIKK
ncbi:MAG TPA: V-type ATPase 116kDa subunit family protein [Candidatus Eisenbacteria bacterium]|nr:V-type ATPase 116kDa subunit family protein [Candidatus Eisenbacteria bacterium]